MVADILWTVCLPGRRPLLAEERRVIKFPGLPVFPSANRHKRRSTLLDRKALMIRASSRLAESALKLKLPWPTSRRSSKRLAST
jgi:hypothetical protein